MIYEWNSEFNRTNDTRGSTYNICIIGPMPHVSHKHADIRSRIDYLIATDNFTVLFYIKILI